MAKGYLEKLSTFIEGATAGRHKNATLECKHFFSGAALYTNERICISLTQVGLAFKLPKDIRNRLLKNKTAISLRFFPKGPVKKSYVLFSGDVEKAGKAYHNYVSESIEYFLTPPKPKRRQK